MLRYVLRRLLIAIPTLLIISLAVFGISKCAPGDPVENIFGDEMILIFEPQQEAKNYQRRAARLGLDKPVFYFNFGTAALPDTIWKIYPLLRRKQLSTIVAQNGNWAATRDYETALNRCRKTVSNVPDSLVEKAYLQVALQDISTKTQLGRLKGSFQIADSIFQHFPATIAPDLKDQMDSLREKVNTVCNQILVSKLYMPAFHWYGLNNQYHHWLTGFITGNWGLTKKQVPVWQELRPALLATLVLNGIAIFFAYCIAIPMGVAMSRRKGRLFDVWSQRALLFIKAMPVFWVGSLLVMFFCSPIFGKPIIANPYLDITDAWNVNRESFLSWFGHKFPKFVLPIIVLTLYSLAVIALQMRGAMLDSLNKDYIRTARAKGVKESQIHWLHAFRNGLFPVITIFGSVFPALFTGSLVIETLFNFPGMGLKAQWAFQGHDLAVLSTILLLAAVLSIIGNLLADLMYAWVDPRVRYASGS